MISFEDDIVLLSNIKRGIDPDISLNILATRYLPLFEKLVVHFGRLYNCKWIDTSDYLIFYTIALRNSVKRYNPLLGSFKTYFNQILANEISKEMVRRINSTDMTNTFISLDSLCEDDLPYHEVIGDDDDLSPQDYTNMNEIKYILRGTTQKKLSPMEEMRLQAINMRVFGFTIREIADRLGVSFTTARRLLETAEEDQNLKKIKIRLK